MTKIEDNLTPKQRAFVDAYLGHANFVAGLAAERAGYAPSTAYAAGSRLLKHDKIQAEIKSRLDDLQSQGMRIRVQRIQALERLLQNLRQVQAERAQAARDRLDNGEDIPTEALTGLMVETKKVAGRVTELVWEIDKTLVQEQQKLIDQISKESGDRVADKLQLSGDAANPVVITSAKEKLRELMEANDGQDR